MILLLLLSNKILLRHLTACNKKYNEQIIFLLDLYCLTNNSANNSVLNLFKAKKILILVLDKREKIVGGDDKR